MVGVIPLHAMARIAAMSPRDEGPGAEGDVIARAPGSSQGFFDVRPLPAVNVLGRDVTENTEA